MMTIFEMELSEVMSLFTTTILICSITIFLVVLKTSLELSKTARNLQRMKAETDTVTEVYSRAKLRRFSYFGLLKNT